MECKHCIYYTINEATFFDGRCALHHKYTSLDDRCVQFRAEEVE